MPRFDALAQVPVRDVPKLHADVQAIIAQARATAPAEPTAAPRTTKRVTRNTPRRTADNADRVTRNTPPGTPHSAPHAAPHTASASDTAARHAALRQQAERVPVATYAYLMDVGDDHATAAEGRTEFLRFLDQQHRAGVAYADWRTAWAAFWETPPAPPENVPPTIANPQPSGARSPAECSPAGERGAAQQSAIALARTALANLFA